MIGAGPAARSLVYGAAVVFAVVAVGPVLLMFWGSFFGETGFTVSAYGEMLGSGRRWGLFANSVGVAAGTALACIVVGGPLAFFVTRVSMPGARCTT